MQHFCSTSSCNLLPSSGNRSGDLWHRYKRIASLGAVLTLCWTWPSLGFAQASKGPSADCTFTLKGGNKPVCAPTTPPPTVLAVTEDAKPADSLTAASPQPSAPPAVPKPKWTLQLQDLTLYAAFSRWAKEAGWRVLWDADKHLLIDSPDVVTGDFEQAITAVVSSPGIVNGAYPLEVCFYPNTPPLVRITKRGEQAKDCK